MKTINHNRKLLVLPLSLFFLNIYMFYNGCNSIPISIFVTTDPVTPELFKQHEYIKVLPEYMVSTEKFQDEDVSGPVFIPSAVPLTIHYFWCGGRHRYFHFENYLSVISAYRFLKPTRIIIHYKELPVFDSVGYYQFFAEMVRSVPILSYEQRENCESGAEKLAMVWKTLNERGGIYIGDSTVLTGNLIRYRNNSISHSLMSTGQGVLMMKKNSSKMQPSEKDIQTIMSTIPAEIQCTDSKSYSKTKHDCLLMDREIFPVDIFTADSDFAELARWVYFGHKSKREPKIYSDKSPLIVHYVWLRDRAMSFFDYLSLLSTVYVLKAENVYIHGDIKPSGEYWQKAEKIPNVHFIFRKFPASVFGNKIVAFASHASDFLRGDLLVRYGGIYMDWDVIWVNPIPDKLRHYDIVVSADPVNTGAYPDVFNMGVLIAQKGTKFMQYFLESYRHYLDEHWSYNAVHMPYKIYELHSDLAYVNPHLQVICSVGKCHPGWLKGFKERDHLSGLAFNWRNESLSLHWTYPDPTEFKSKEALLASNSMFGEIGKFVLKAAGI